MREIRTAGAKIIRRRFAPRDRNGNRKWKCWRYYRTRNISRRHSRGKIRRRRYEGETVSRLLHYCYLHLILWRVHLFDASISCMQIMRHMHAHVCAECSNAADLPGRGDSKGIPRLISAKGRITPWSYYIPHTKIPEIRRHGGYCYSPRLCTRKEITLNVSEISIKSQWSVRTWS